MTLAITEYRTVAVWKRERAAGVDPPHGVAHFGRQGGHRARRLVASTGGRRCRVGNMGARQHPSADDDDQRDKRDKCQPASTHPRSSLLGRAAKGQRKRTFNVARPKIFRPPDFAPTMTTPLRVAGSNDLIFPLNSMSAPSAADTIAGAESRIA